jgi:hypothetical protein
MNDVTRLTDPVGVIGIDATDYGEDESHETTVDVSLLKQGLEVIETLGWDQVDVRTVQPNGDVADYPLLVLRPPEDSFFGAEGQAGIAIAPRTEQGREGSSLGDGDA